MNMNNVDFHLLTGATIEASGTAIGKIVEELYKQDKTIFIYTDNAGAAKWIDDLLWTFHDIGFIPHAMTGNKELEVAPVQISDYAPPLKNFDILINLAVKVPSFFTEFSKIIEFIPENEELKKFGREKYKFYRDQKCNLQTLNLKP
jgi:DNA polymerase III subunit chi